ncbi:subtilase family protein [Tripterygium wilfordii]|uniref:Subtilase family protein n=1 Tax=Tripterygium wilfordii TaxID=458696 RepID=A0A7J7D9S6_TRIWF|nr:subtilase family protein [Tripterygium wilfordii]
MASMACLWILLLIPSFATAAKQTYIVHMNSNSMPSSFATQHDWYKASLQSISSSSGPDSDSLIYTYTTAFHGFAASLDLDQAELLRQDEALGLVYSKGSSSTSNLCLPGSLDQNQVRGKVVVCDRGVNARVEKGSVVREAGGVGMILANTAASGEELVADSHLVPAVAVGKKAGDIIRGYVKTDPHPTALLSFGGTVLNVRPKRIVRYTRVLTNVGAAGAVYQLAITKPSTVDVQVKPTTLVFKSVGQKQRYTVTFVAKANATSRPEFGSIVWSNALNRVSSPVAFTWSRVV